MNIPLEIIVYLGVFLGILGRTYFPYLKKTDDNKANPDFAFQIRYVITAVIAAAITAVLIFNSFIIPSGTTFQIFIASFVFAWGTNDLINKLV